MLKVDQKCPEYLHHCYYAEMCFSMNVCVHGCDLQSQTVLFPPLFFSVKFPNAFLHKQ